MMDTGLAGPLGEVASAMHSWEGPGSIPGQMGRALEDEAFWGRKAQATGPPWELTAATGSQSGPPLPCSPRVAHPGPCNSGPSLAGQSRFLRGSSRCGSLRADLPIPHSSAFHNSSPGTQVSTVSTQAISHADPPSASPWSSSLGLTCTKTLYATVPK